MVKQKLIQFDNVEDKQEPEVTLLSLNESLFKQPEETLSKLNEFLSKHEEEVSRDSLSWAIPGEDDYKFVEYDDWKEGLESAIGLCDVLTARLEYELESCGIGEIDDNAILAKKRYDDAVETLIALEKRYDDIYM
jgi:hypothetical protein